MVGVVHVARSQRLTSARCPFCHGGIERGEASWTCAKCATPHHLDCAMENHACTVMGCRHPIAPAMTFDRWSLDQHPARRMRTERQRFEELVAGFALLVGGVAGIAIGGIALGPYGFLAIIAGFLAVWSSVSH